MPRQEAEPHETEVEIAAKEPRREPIEPEVMPGAASVSEAIIVPEK